MLLWCLIEKFVIKFGFEKRGIFNKIPFLHKAFHGDFWKRDFFYFYQQASSLIGNQTIHSLPYQPNSRYESGYECICIVTNGKNHSVPLNILNSVVHENNSRSFKVKYGVSFHQKRWQLSCHLFWCKRTLLDSKGKDMALYTWSI